MNKNEFAENLVKEFSVKHPNYSASVKKPEEELALKEKVRGSISSSSS